MKYNDRNYTSVKSVEEQIQTNNTKMHELRKEIEETKMLLSKTTLESIKVKFQEHIESQKQTHEAMMERNKDLCEVVMPSVVKEEEKAKQIEEQINAKVRKAIKHVYSSMKKDPKFDDVDFELGDTASYGEETMIKFPNNVVSIAATLVYPGDVWSRRPAELRIELSASYALIEDRPSRKYIIKKDGTTNAKKIKEVILEWLARREGKLNRAKQQETIAEDFRVGAFELLHETPLNGKFEKGYDTWDYHHGSRGQKRRVDEALEIYKGDAGEFKSENRVGRMTKAYRWTKDNPLYRLAITDALSAEKVKAILDILNQ